MADQIEATPEIREYVRAVSLREDPILTELREETAGLPAGTAMQLMAEEGQLLALLVGLCGATSVLEIGTFTGYSTLCMARALPAGGTVVTLDVNERWPAIGAGYWKRAGVADRIDARIGDATKTLAALADERGGESFDLVFIDADKANYGTYYEAALDLTRVGGLIVIDNTLFFGRVVDPDSQDPDTTAVRALNASLRDDPRVEVSMLTMADGITLARKK
ncbi:O-methyltransferase [Kitasatospora aureofaciens]|uniref:O-methyltransferase n=1 Tax=Kitasatospora aureofaciens TaxID=1894 RepID=A0A1E7N9F4_KITAU|nr:class I SAM-dependent methyltransferase [Kitasatospora aureofaciens]OEV37274.1 SAM-dependent methyltransferase [Kitasatospora aureofaciens]GGU95693.1 O-methyltransferase [Kitasatospora aureofaciens]